jgi:hypothetical protein
MSRLAPLGVVMLVALVALASACGESDPAPTPPLAKATLAVEIRQAVDVTLTHASKNADGSGLVGEGGVDVDLAFAATGDYAFFDAAQAFHARGRVEPFPEADASMLTARFSLPARAGSPCGAQPVSLSLALMRRGANERVGGGLTVYCGADVWAGVPKRLFRISGDLPLATP